MLRFAELRIDASSLQELPGGGVKVVGQLTHPGIFTYRNVDGSLRKEYRPSEEVFSKSALATLAGLPVTVNHPRPGQPPAERLVTAKSWRQDAVGHLGENVREDNGNVVADLYVRDAATAASLRAGNFKHISLGYEVDYDPTPGTCAEGRFDGVQKNMRGNHVAILPVGVAPRGGSDCVLRLDSNGDQESDALKSDRMDIEALNAKVTALESELAKARVDAAELVTVKAALAAANKSVAELAEQVKPERLDALADARGITVAAAKAEGIDPAGKSTLALKRAIVAKRTPALAARVDSMNDVAVDDILSVYGSQPHPTLAAPLTVLAPVVEKPVPGARTDGNPMSIGARRDKFLADSKTAWQNAGDKVN